MMVFYTHRSALWARTALFALLATPLWGCNPIDQRTFDPQAGRPPRVAAPALPVAAPGKPAFLQIIEGTPEEEYGPAVEKAAKLALSRKSNILFTVQGIAPMQKTPEAERETLHTLTQNLVSPVANHILAAGARPIQLDMRVSTDPTVHSNMVRIYVR
ncbi:hypothetical protein GM556_06565 [Bombella sp. ESL0378]|uniref:hypothetical protein n=1 Tax=Bombella sp. ESL0378 TaxID=2676442 RepID=UPI0012D8D4FA|nr:hypothetical protein [Bombella sp. ESL0378]MUG05204.1 hypothetical protein [Bombella sp. ESL0378]